MDSQVTGYFFLIGGAMSTSHALITLRLKTIQNEANNMADELTKKAGTNNPKVWRTLYPNEYFMIRRKLVEYQLEEQKITDSIQNQYMNKS